MLAFIISVKEIEDIALKAAKNISLYSNAGFPIQGPYMYMKNLINFLSLSNLNIK